MKSVRSAVILLLSILSSSLWADATVAWQAMLDPTTNASDSFIDSVQDSEGNIYVLTRSGGVDVYIYKISPNGGVPWLAFYSTSPGSSTDSPMQIVLDPSENPIAILREDVTNTLILRKYAKTNGGLLWQYSETVTAALELVTDAVCDSSGKTVLLHFGDAITQISNSGAFVSRSSDLWQTNTILSSKIALRPNDEFAICGVTTTNGNNVVVGGVSSTGAAQWLYTLQDVPGGSAVDLEVDAADGTIYLLGSSVSNYILWINPNGTFKYLWPISGTPRDLVETADDLYYITSGPSMTVGVVEKATQIGSEFTRDLLAGTDTPASLEVDANGNMYVATDAVVQSSVRLLRVAPGGASAYEKELQPGSRSLMRAHKVYLAGTGAVLIGAGFESSTSHEVFLSGIERFDYSVSAASIPGGNALTGTLTFPDGAWVSRSMTLTSNSSNVEDRSVDVTAGENSVLFPIKSQPVMMDEAVTLNLSQASTEQSYLKAVTLQAPRPATLTVEPTSVVGGNDVAASLTMTGFCPDEGVPVKLSDNSDFLNTPPWVVFGSEQIIEPFFVGTRAVGATATRKIFASAYGVTISAAITLLPAALSSLVVEPDWIVAGGTATGTVRLNGAAQIGGKPVALSDESSAISTPSSVNVPAGAFSATFPVSTLSVSSITTRRVFATADGITKQFIVTLKPGVNIQSLVLAQSSIKGGTNVNATVTLTGAAPALGANVTLSDNSSILNVPPSLPISAGNSSGVFVVETAQVTSSATRQIYATYNGITKTANLTITP